MRCQDCKETTDPSGLCGQCMVQARNTIREKLHRLLSDPANWNEAEWRVIYDIYNKILAF